MTLKNHTGRIDTNVLRLFSILVFIRHLYLWYVHEVFQIRLMSNQIISLESILVKVLSKCIIDQKNVK